MEKIVYHNNFGFGKVLEETSEALDILFENKETKRIVPSFVTKLDDSFTNNILNEEFEKDFAGATLTKARSYASNSHVKNIVVKNKGKTIKATVEGTESYNTCVEADGKNFTYICSCPVGFYCKHAAAVLYSLEDRFKALDRLKSTGLALPQVNTKELSSSFLDCKELVDAGSKAEIEPTVENVMNYINLLNKSDPSKLNSFLIYLNQGKMAGVQVKYLFYANHVVELCESLSLTREAVKFFEKYGKKFMPDFKYGFNKSKAPDYLYYIIVNNKLNGFINAIDCNVKNIDEYYQYVRTHYKKEELYALIDSLSRYNHYSQKVTDFARKLLGANFLDYAITTKNIIEIAFSDIKNLDDKTFSSLLPKVAIDSEVKRYVEKNFQILFNKCPDSLLILLERICIDSWYLSDIYQIFIDDYNNKYLSHYFYNDLFKDESIDKAEFFKYLYLSYECSKDKNQYLNFKFNLCLGSGHLALSLTCDDDLMLVKYETVKRYFSNDLVVNTVYEEAISRFKDEILEKYKSEIAESKQNRYNEERRYSLGLLKSLDENLIDLQKGAIVVNKPMLELSFTSESNSILMDIKIGCNKMYVGRGTKDILINFYNRATYKYGKELTFTHDYKNLAAPYDKLIEYMISLPLESLVDYKSIKLNGINANNIFKILENQYVYFDNKLYHIVSEKPELKYFLDSNYSLTLNNTNSTCHTLGNLLIELNEDSGVLRFKMLDKKDSMLFRFVSLNENRSIKPVMEEFKNVVLSRYSDVIEIDNSIKDECKLSSLQIDAYFDIVNKNLAVTTKYTKDGSVATNLSGLDKLAKENYLNYLSELGFVDGLCKNEEDIYNFIQMDFNDLKRLCNVYLSDSIKDKTIVTMDTPMFEMSYNSGIMDICFEDSSFSDSELEEILRALRHKKKYIMLKDNRIVDLENENAQEFFNLVEDMNLNTKHLTKKQPLPIYQVLNGYAHDKNVKMDDYLGSMIEHIAKFKNANIELPCINATLRSYQREGFNWLSILSEYHMGGILADDMGLGKTLQIITLLASRTEEMPSLIVCPKSLIFNWLNEFKKFAPKMEVESIHGFQSTREKIISTIDNNKNVVYITSYDSVRQDIELYEKKVFDFIIIDEAQYIKNSQAQKSISVKMLNAKNRFALTGTPIENNILDLWSIFDFIMPGYFEEVSTFKNRYQTSESYSERIKKKISPFILRRTKENVLKDLPSKYERIVSAEMTLEQRKLYDAHRKIVKDAMIAGGKTFDMLPLLTRLRQICVDPKMFVEGYSGGSGKIDLVLDTIMEYIENGHRILLFSQFVKGLNEIEELLVAKHVKYLMITGDTKAIDRINYTERFNTDDSIKIVLISLKAGGTGLNLIGADTVIHLDPWWNVAAENQATDRAHRIGQTRNVEVIKFICEDSVEQRVIELQNMKKDVIDKFISNDESSVSSISKADLQFILDI